MMKKEKSCGFTLVELVIVIVVLGAIGATIAIFLRPAFDSYFSTVNRAALHDDAELSVRHLLRDVRRAVPNSLRLPEPHCVEMVPSSANGRLRMASDSVNDSNPPCTPGNNCSAPLDVTQPSTSVDVLTPFDTDPVSGDFLVVGNQNVGDIYSGANRVSLSSVANTPNAKYGTRRLGFAATQFSPGFATGRFAIVPRSQQAVFYVCTGLGVDAHGNGTGSLYRMSGYGFNPSYPAACPATAGGQLMVDKLVDCNFIYSPTQGATEQYGFVAMQLTLMINNERATLSAGAHVLNVP
ncbi:MAG TPA: prepilin-type N-terminal cleavage/methylation domain-containing protein [Burkholderiaceae bacterium]|jgi:MSHA biogenesis protein MshO